MKIRRLESLTLIVLVLGVLVPCYAGQQDKSKQADTTAADGLWKRLRQASSINVQALLQATENSLTSNSLFNPGNRIVQVPGGEFTLEVRPDFQFAAGRIKASAKPRLRHRTDFAGLAPGARSEFNEGFMQEWALRLRATRDLEISYGREVLLWGPSASFSPSNPFFTDNGRANPIRELGGRDFVRAVYASKPAWSISYIGNTALGRGDGGPQPFTPIHALKFDYTGNAYTWSIIGSRANGDSVVVGGHAQVTASNALLLYGEGKVRHGSRALYPVRSAGLGWQMLDAKRNSGLFFSAVTGASYTLRTGWILTSEYISNREGYSPAERSDYYDAGAAASTSLASGGEQAQAATALLADMLNPNLPLLGRNYISVQMLRADYHGRADMMVRYTENMDDNSGTATGYLTCNWNDRVQLFALGILTNGTSRTESGRLLRHQLSVGARLFLR